MYAMALIAAIPALIIIVFCLRFMLWMLLAPDQALVFMAAATVGVSWIGPSLTSDPWGVLTWALAIAVLCSGIYSLLLIVLHQRFPRVSRIVNLVLMVPVSGIFFYKMGTESFANSLPRLADDLNLNLGIYAVIAALIGLALWMRRIRKLDEWTWSSILPRG